jgi:hypothetical protein
MRYFRCLDLGRERGQVLPLLAAAGLVVLLGMTALVLDVGHALVVKRQLQASADAAALAGAGTMYGDPANARAMALAYSAGGKNAPAGATIGAPLVTTACSRAPASCASADTMVVKESAEVKTSFAHIFGIASFSVGAKAAACASCGAVPLDVMILLDRTGSMSDGDMNNAQRGIETLLRYLNPRLDRVGFAVTPPAEEMTPPYDAESDAYVYGTQTDTHYVLMGLTNEYKRADGSLDMSSPLLSTIENVRAGGATSYALALEQANAELVRHARTYDGKPVKKVLIFMSDGAANTAQLSAYPNPRAASTRSWGDRQQTGTVQWSPYITEPCGQAVRSAEGLKGSDPVTGTEIFTIGYGIDRDSGENQCFEAPHYSRTTSVGYREVREGMTARQALQQIASRKPDHFLEPGQGADLRDIFADIADTLLPARLVTPPPDA